MKDGECSKPMLPLDDFLAKIKMRLLERTIYTRNLEPFSISTGEIPPIMAPRIAGSIVNTENKKKSVYLRDKSNISGNIVHFIHL
jgi:hypothetical protein